MSLRIHRRRYGILAGAILAAAAMTNGSATAASVDNSENISAPPPEAITVDVVTVNGSGCPAGTVGVRVLPDNTGFALRYSNFVASVGGSAAPTDFRKNCQVNLQIHVPQGFTYAVARADYTGTARLRSGVTALQRANYYYSGSPVDNISDHTFTGPLYGRWRASDTTTEAALIYSPCGVDRNLNINTELRVTRGTSTAASSIRMTATSGGVDTIYHFSWKTCP